MLLTIDVGNTQTVLGLYDPDTETGDGAAVGLVDHWRISTVHERTSDEYSVMVRSMLDTTCLLYTSPSPRDVRSSRMPSSA